MTNTDKIFHDGSDDPHSAGRKFDEETLELFFRQNFKTLCAYCQTKFNFDIDTAKEMVQAGFIKLWETRSSLAPHQSPRAYLYKIITNNCLDTIRHNKIKYKHRISIQHNSYSHLFDEHSNPADLRELNETIDRSIAELPQQMRRIFELSRYEGMKYGQIASALDISVKTVETQMSRALFKLRQKLSKYILLFLIIINFCKKFL